jgi:hypothetical protein
VLAAGIGNSTKALEPVGDDGRACRDDPFGNALHPLAIEPSDAPELDFLRSALAIRLHGHDKV